LRGALVQALVPMSDTPPDRLSVNPKSPHFEPELLQRGIGIMFNGAEKHNVEEYCVSEGWIRIAMAKSVDRKGNPLTMKLNGTVEPFFKGPAVTEDEAPAEDGGEA
jgi:hypothetical protein